MRTAIVILNWNGRHHLERFLGSVTAHTAAPTRIIVADNGSTDSSLEFLAERYPQVERLRLDRNYGYAGGYNRALQLVDADCYVLLNSDVEVSEGMARTTRRHAGARPRSCWPWREDTVVHAATRSNMRRIGRLHRHPRLPFLPRAHTLARRARHGAVRHPARGILGQRRRLLLPRRHIPPHGGLRCRLLCPHGGDRPMLAHADRRVQGHGGAAQPRLPSRRRHHAQRVAQQAVP